MFLEILIYKDRSYGIAAAGLSFNRPAVRCVLCNEVAPGNLGFYSATSSADGFYTMIIILLRDYGIVE
jgi:hypothetical protein